VNGHWQAVETVSCSCRPAFLVDVGRQLDKGHSRIVMASDLIRALAESLQGAIQKQVEPFNGVSLSPVRAKDTAMQSRYFHLIEPDALPPLIDATEEICGPMILNVL
jgi:hypothetical protein